MSCVPPEFAYAKTALGHDWIVETFGSKATRALARARTRGPFRCYLANASEIAALGVVRPDMMAIGPDFDHPELERVGTAIVAAAFAHFAATRRGTRLTSCRMARYTRSPIGEREHRTLLWFDDKVRSFCRQSDIQIGDR